MESSEFRRVSDLFRDYLAKKVDKEDMRAELAEAGEETLEKMSRRFSYGDLRKFFRWGAVLGEFGENKELRRYIISKGAVSFYLACCIESIFLEKLSGLAREIYKEGEGVVENYNNVAKDDNRLLLSSSVEVEYWWQDPDR